VLGRKRAGEGIGGGRELVRGGGAVAGRQQQAGAQWRGERHRDDRDRQQCPGRGGEPQVQHGGAGCAAGRPPAGAGDDGRRHHDHAVPGEMGAPAQVEVARDPGRAGVEPRVETLQGVPDVAAHEHPGTADREDVAAPVVLALVDLVAVDAGHPQPQRRRGEADVEQPLVVVPADLLAAGDADGGSGLDGQQELLEGVVSGCRVVREEPEPLDGGGRRRGVVLTSGGLRPPCTRREVRRVGVGQGGGRPEREDGVDGVRGGGGAGQPQHRQGAAGGGEQGGGVVAGTEVGAGEGVGPAGLRGQGREDARQAIGAVPGEDDGDDVCPGRVPAATGGARERREVREGGGGLTGEVESHDHAGPPAQTACFLTRRRSRSDRPPQMPKRSSFSSA
jgi:hypothetical protein